MGREYVGTRHNIGFEIVDRFAEKHNLKFLPGKGKYFIAGSGDKFASPFFLVKPTTYVNGSGIAALQLSEEIDFDLNNFLVVVDDINLPTGKIRIRGRGGDGGHNGLNSLIYHLESEDFPRLRFGIGNDFERGEMADYVLSPFNKEEIEIIKEKIDFSAQLIEVFIKEGYVAMLNFLAKSLKD